MSMDNQQEWSACTLLLQRQTLILGRMICLNSQCLLLRLNFFTKLSAIIIFTFGRVDRKVSPDETYALQAALMTSA